MTKGCCQEPQLALCCGVSFRQPPTPRNQPSTKQRRFSRPPTNRFALNNTTSAEVNRSIQIVPHHKLAKWPTGTRQPSTPPQTRPLLANIESRRWSIIIGFVVVVAMAIAAWFFSPKGENQVYGSPILPAPVILMLY
jgi:hypothetical protein